MTGMKPSVEIKEKMRISHLGKKYSKETRAKMSKNIRKAWKRVQENRLLDLVR